MALTDIFRNISQSRFNPITQARAAFGGGRAAQSRATANLNLQRQKAQRLNQRGGETIVQLRKRLGGTRLPRRPQREQILASSTHRDLPSFGASGFGGITGAGQVPGIDLGQVDALFNPALEANRQRAAAFEASKAGVLGAVDVGAQRALGQLGQSKEEAVARNVQAQKTREQRTQDLRAAARQIRGELEQASGQRFGGRGQSSVAGAAGELLDRATQQQFGAISSQDVAKAQELEGELGRIESTFNQQSQLIQDQVSNQKAQIESEFARGLADINADNALTEQQKAAAKLDLLNRQRELQFQADQSAISAARELDIFRQQSAIEAESQSGISKESLDAFKALRENIPVTEAARLSGLSLAGVPEESIINQLRNVGGLAGTSSIDPFTGQLFTGLGQGEVAPSQQTFLQRLFGQS